MLEVIGLPYRVKPIDLGKLVQKEDWYVALNPNGRIPTIGDRDADDFAVFESEELPHLERWMDVIGERPAVQRGRAVPAAREVEEVDPAEITKAAQKVLQR